MFTSEPSVSQRIERLISVVPVVDTRSDLDADHPGATDLAALIGELPVRLVLQGVGMPADLLDPTRSVEDRVADVLPWLRQVRTTAAGWCLFRIFRDLYDFDEPHLTPENAGALIERVATAAANPDWSRAVIEDRARIRLVVAPVANRTTAGLPDFLLHRLEIVSGSSSDQAPEAIRTQVFDQLDRQIDGRVRFVSFTEPPGTENPVHAAVLQWHQLHRWPVQILLDLTPPAVALERLYETIQRYPHARFALLTGRAELGPAVARLAARFPNVFADEFAGHGAFPATIEANVLSRIEQAGISKVGGFASGAATAEWIYGSWMATRKATAAALARAVAHGFFEEDELPPLLQSLFATAASDWYRLPEGGQEKPNTTEAKISHTSPRHL